MANPVPTGALTISLNTSNYKQTVLNITDIGTQFTMYPNVSYDLGMEFSQFQISNSIQLKQGINAGYITAASGGTTPD